MSLHLIAACAPAVVAVPWFGLSRWGKVRRRRVEFAAASTPSGIVAGMACALILKEPERVDFGTKWEDRDRGIAVASTDSSLCSPAGQRFTGQTLKFRGERIDLDIHAQERIYRTMQEAVRINKERAKARARRENELRACDAIAAVMGTDPETVARNHGLLEGEVGS